MSAVKIIAIGDNVCDKYLSRGKMYPGGQCVNTCAYAAANGVPSAYLGKFGSDEVAAYNQKILHELGIDISHEMLDETKKRNADPKIEYRLCGVEYYDCPAAA